MKNKINPVGLKGNEVNERIKELMGVGLIKEDVKNSAVELTKMGPDGNIYAVVRENHQYFIKSTSKKENLTVEDFNYIGGLQNKVDEAYPSYAKALKHLNLKFNSLAEAYNVKGGINVFESDNAYAAGFTQNEGNGFSNEGNMEGNEPLVTEGNEFQNGTKFQHNGELFTIVDMSNPEHISVKSAQQPEKQGFYTLKALEYYLRNNDIQISNGLNEEEEIELSEEEQAVADMVKENDEVEEVQPIEEGRLLISKAMTDIDGIIDSLSEGKKKTYTLR